MRDRKPKVVMPRSILNNNAKGGTITARVPKELHLRFRKSCLESGQNMNTALAFMIEKYIDHTDKVNGDYSD